MVKLAKTISRGGKRFSLHTTTATKRKARERAAVLRKKGWNVRIGKPRMVDDKDGALTYTSRQYPIYKRRP